MVAVSYDWPTIVLPAERAAFVPWQTSSTGTRRLLMLLLLLQEDGDDLMKCTLLSTPPSHTHSHSHTCKTIKTGRSLQVTYECKAGQWSLIINTALHYQRTDSLTLGDSKSVIFSPTSFDMARPGIAPALLACHEVRLPLMSSLHKTALFSNPQLNSTRSAAL